MTVDLSLRAALAESDRWQFRKAAAPGLPVARAFAVQWEVRGLTGAGVEVRGLASATGEVNGYDMHDRYGQYREWVKPGAFSRTLSQKPAVKFLENHGGRPFANTRNDTLWLAEDQAGADERNPFGRPGLLYGANMDTSRGDSADLVKTIERGDYDECSFSFRVDEGGQQWSADFTERALSCVNMHRGDVCVATFGANPNTGAVAARADAALAALREGRAVAPEDVSLLSMVLGWLTAIDTIVDAGQLELASRLGVPNPDADDLEDQAAEAKAAARSQRAAKVSDAPWSPSTADYTPEQWRRACIVDTEEGEPSSKARYKCPIREPDGTLNRNGVYAAAGAHGIGAVQGISDVQRTAAAHKLLAAYEAIGAKAPDSLTSMAGRSAGMPLDVARLLAS